MGELRLAGWVTSAAQAGMRMRRLRTELGREERHRAFAWAVALLVITASFLAVLAVVPQNARALTLFVGGGGPGNYTTIQAGVNAANPGDTVYVFRGMYRESVNIARPISLVGEDRDATIIDGLRAGRTVSISASQVTLRGFTITNGNQNVQMASVTGCVISDNVITNGGSGISLTNTLGATIVGNVVSSNSGNGIELTTSGSNTIADNVIASNGNYGISVYASVGNDITGNVASSSRRGIYLDSSSSNTIADNTVLSNYDSYNPYGAGIWLRSSSSNVLTDNDASSNYQFGIRLEFSASNTLTRNVVSSNQEGISLLSSSVNLLEANSVSWNYRGVVLESSSTNTIRDSRLSSNQESGLTLRDSGDNTVYGNSISSNRYTGIRFYLSSDNRVFRNNIAGNLRQAEDDSENTWDEGYPSGGNYWSDYDGADLRSGPLQDLAGSDGIGDTLYYISYGASVDRYPKIGPNSAPLSPPSQPLNLAAVPTDGQVSLTWTPPTYDGGSPVLNYRIYRRTGYASEEYVAQIGTIPMYTDSGLTNGVSYSFRVAARNVVGEGLRSDVAETIPATVPGPPLGLAAVAESRLVTLTWIPPVDNGGSVLTNYAIYRGTNPGSRFLLAEIGDVIQYVDIGLANGQTYYYAVAAENAVGEGAASDGVAATPTAVFTVPGPPVRLSASGGDRRVTLTWEPPVDNGGSPVSRYSVYRGLFIGGEAFLEEVRNELTYADVGLQNGQTYFYRVAAATSIGEGAKSDSLGAVPHSVPDPPIALSAAAGNGQVTLTWLAPVDTGGAPLTHFSIYRGTTPGEGTYVASTSVDTRTYRDTDLTNGVRYYYRVTASSTFGEGPMSTEVASTPSASVISIPPGLQVFEQTWFWLLVLFVAFTVFVTVFFARRKRKTASEAEAQDQKQAGGGPQPQDPSRKT